MKNKLKNCWRYQAVYIEREHKDGKITKEYSMCEIYLDKKGKLEAWTESKSIAPYGESVEELNKDIQFMLNDLSKWTAVAFESLYVGMEFNNE